MNNGIILHTLDRKYMNTGEMRNDAFKQNNTTRYGSNAILNFNVLDLKAEYERVKKLDIGKVTEILYINIVMPYYCFMLEDPDWNRIEITGNYE